MSKLLENYADEPIRGIDPSKYQPPSVPQGASVEELIEAERRGRLGEGHMALRWVDYNMRGQLLTTRNENIEVIQSYGPNAWLVRNYQLNSQLSELQETLKEMKEKVVEVNRTRRVFQEDQGEHLTRLESRWMDLVRSTVQLEMASTAMEGEVLGLESREQELRAEVAKLEA